MGKAVVFVNGSAVNSRGNMVLYNDFLIEVSYSDVDKLTLNRYAGSPSFSRLTVPFKLSDNSRP